MDGLAEFEGVADFINNNGLYNLGLNGLVDVEGGADFVDENCLHNGNKQTHQKSRERKRERNKK